MGHRFMHLWVANWENNISQILTWKNAKPKNVFWAILKFILKNSQILFLYSPFLEVLGEKCKNTNYRILKLNQASSQKDVKGESKTHHEKQKLQKVFLFSFSPSFKEQQVI